MLGMSCVVLSINYFYFWFFHLDKMKELRLKITIILDIRECRVIDLQPLEVLIVIKETLFFPSFKRSEQLFINGCKTRETVMLYVTRD